MVQVDDAFTGLTVLLDRNIARLFTSTEKAKGSL